MGWCSHANNHTDYNKYIGWIKIISVKHNIVSFLFYICGKISITNTLLFLFCSAAYCKTKIKTRLTAQTVDFCFTLCSQNCKKLPIVCFMEIFPHINNEMIVFMSNAVRVFFTVTSFFNYYFVYMIDKNYISKCSEAVGP